MGVLLVLFVAPIVLYCSSFFLAVTMLIRCEFSLKTLTQSPCGLIMNALPVVPESVPWIPRKGLRPALGPQARGDRGSQVRPPRGRRERSESLSWTPWPRGSIGGDYYSTYTKRLFSERGRRKHHALFLFLALLFFRPGPLILYQARSIHRTQVLCSVFSFPELRYEVTHRRSRGEKRRRDLVKTLCFFLASQPLLLLPSTRRVKTPQPLGCCY